MAQRSSLPPLLRHGLAVVFVGTEPGKRSLAEGHYYADPTNSFYEDLAEARFTPTRLRAEDDHRLLEYGIGLDDVHSERSGIAKPA